MKQPLVVFLCWHPSSSTDTVSLIEACYKKLCRDPDRPFSRGMQIPVFYRSIPVGNGDKPLPIPIKNQERTAIFFFVDDNMVASDSWNSYIDEMVSTLYVPSDNHRIFIVALTPNAFNLTSKITQTNFIRLYEYSSNTTEKILFINMAHELCRLLQALPKPIGSDNRFPNKSVRLFISHAKRDNKGLTLATAIKNITDDSTLSRFFDKVDINPGVDFAHEIEASIKDSTVVCIRSESYSSRPWCQKEVILAKRYRRPLIVIDILEAFEDRMFPYLGNIPSIRLSTFDFNDKRALYTIIESALLETLRCYYANEYLEFLKQQELIPREALVLTRPPELMDIGLFMNDYSNDMKAIYPDPPLESDEVVLIQNESQIFFTPLTTESIKLHGLKVGLSISNPEVSDLASIGLDDRHIKSFLNELTRHLILCDAQLLYGGDLQKNGYTEFLFDTAKHLKAKYRQNLQRIRDYLAWPVYLDLDNEWVASNKGVAEFIRVAPPGDIFHQISDLKKSISCDTGKNRVIWARCLEEMRKRLIQESDARISLGGKCFGYKGKYPGILEEALMAIEMQKPLYVLGGFGGASKQIALAILGKDAPAFEMGCQVSHKDNPGYKDMALEFNNKIDPSLSERIDYTAALLNLSTFGVDGLSNLNGLTNDENLLLFETTCQEEAIRLLLKGLTYVYRNKIDK